MSEFDKAIERKEDNEYLKRQTLLKIHHEIRTPLNAILGFIQIITEDPTISKKEKEKYLLIISKVSKDVLVRIDDIMKAIL